VAPRWEARSKVLARRKMTMFERCLLGLAAGLVAAVVAAAAVSPPTWTTTAPKAVLRLAASALIPAKERTASALAALADAMARGSALHLDGAFSRLGYDLQDVVVGGGAVPRLFLASVPRDMATIREARERKAVFLRTVLPLVLQVNEEILADRARLWDLRMKRRLGQRLEALDRLWLAAESERYRVRRGDIDALLFHIDVIPPSLALAQAAEESGWGTSRFAREGNAVFGQWIFSTDGGLTPSRRDIGLTHGVRAFPSLLDGARAYARNLNRHRAYRRFRARRAEMRRAGERLDGGALAATLSRYSERGEAYVATIRRLIESNALGALDDARLSAAGRGI
jgi:Bax protein